MTGWQANQVLVAIELLDAEQFADGEWVMMKVERPDLLEPPAYVGAVQHDAQVLRERLDRAPAE